MTTPESFAHDAATPPVRVLLLGPVAIVRPDGVQQLGERQRAVLNVLATRLGEVVPTDHLIERAWGGNPPKSAGAALRVHVSKLRAALSVDAIALEHTGVGYCIDPALVTTDVIQLGELLDRIAASEPAEALPLIEEALALFRGDPMLELDDDESLAEAESLLAQREQLREDQVEAMIELGRDAAAAVTAAELVRADPLNERRTRQLMLALYRTGRQADALAAGGRLRDLLREDLGVDPDPETRRLEVRILRQDQSLLRPRSGTPGPDRSQEPARPRQTADRISVPVRMLVAERLVDVSPIAQDLAGLIAALDDLAYPEVLVSASGHPDTVVARALTELTTRHLIVAPGPDNPVTLQRPEFATALLEAVDDPSRAALHERAADALGEVLDPTPSVLTATAWHLLDAASCAAEPHSPDDCARAVGAVAQAAASCLEAGFPAAAQELCTATLALDLTPTARVDLTRLHIQSLISQGLVDRAEEEWTEAVEAARALGDSERFALTVLTRTWVTRSVMVQTNLPDVLAEADQQLGPGSSALRVRVQATIMLENTVPGRIPPSEEQLHQLREAAQKMGDPESLRFVLFAEHARLRGSPEAERREEVGRELLRLSENLPVWESRALAEQAHDFFVRGHFADVPALLERLNAAAIGPLQERARWLRQLIQTSLHRDLGRFDEADREAESALLRGAAAGVPDAMAAEATHHLVSMLLRDSTVPFLPALERFLAAAPHNPVTPVARGLALAQAGRPEDALASLHPVVPAVLATPTTEFTLYILALATEALWAGAPGPHELIEQLHARVRPHSGQWIAMGLVSSSLGPVDRILGQLSALAGRTEDARAEFIAAQQEAARAGSPVWQVRTAADRTRIEPLALAAELATEFEPLAEQLGMAPCVAAFQRVRPAIA
ncbi:BTAD domain-containing putative transcriptional regulator [Ammonicoccus fulvus]|uniref:BTAD domain-containing putative transcriptional regulator n=1 Tax=Ammonicoccus fulvus TaxID=3138240 RepID=A0ABZ3FNB6_9ACTN